MKDTYGINSGAYVFEEDSSIVLESDEESINLKGAVQEEIDEEINFEVDSEELEGGLIKIDLKDSIEYNHYLLNKFLQESDSLYKYLSDAEIVVIEEFSPINGSEIYVRCCTNVIRVNLIGLAQKIRDGGLRGSTFCCSECGKYIVLPKQVIDVYESSEDYLLSLKHLKGLRIIKREDIDYEFENI